MSYIIKRKKAKLAHINLREEKHGEEPALACDIKLSLDIENDFLTVLDPGLKAALYKSVKGAAQASLVDDSEHLPLLRFANLDGAIAWKDEFVAVVTFHGGKKIDDWEFAADINQLRLTPAEGGTVGVTLRAQFLPDAELAGQLAGLLGREIKLSLEPFSRSDKNAQTQRGADVEAPAKDGDESHPASLLQ